MALNLTAIKEALAAQISTGADRATTVRPFRTPAKSFPCITMTIEDITYFTTMGPDGQAQVDMELKIWINTVNPDSAEIAMCDFLSAGVGNSSSIADAVNADPTLGGVVESCKVLEIGSPDDDDEGNYVAVFPLQILTRKAGAQA